ncbi:hypothetical protein ISF_01537 [Cordyceps fumosorosea ARSEF 2679]|uniref:Uncharacterized protein n=1 Tax=Cordyceps fumosorosea (strain ARSEF 2679) TaxID=1081104 RepID=A0A162LLP8_CORFA|nr:hypothetical protein ISF_01537 [Cordyceps fumosorosea ARSEF 2679]OAA72464.1 hypothetical protein ISF_01537 [Cordyceps fumosorosea ARSEF 2679]
MNDRGRNVNGSSHHPPPPLQRTRLGAPSAASAPAYQAPPAASSRDRTNLFRSHLIRRPTGAAANGTSSSASSFSATAAAATAAAAAAAAALATHPDTARLAAAEEQQRMAEMCEIVVRNQNGDIDLEGAPVLPFDDIDEMALDARQETEQERQRLAEAVVQHRINYTAVPDQPEELLEAVRASLRAKVDALAEDNWMFEPEEQPQG